MYVGYGSTKVINIFNIEFVCVHDDRFILLILVQWRPCVADITRSLF